MFRDGHIPSIKDIKCTVAMAADLSWRALLGGATFLGAYEIAQRFSDNVPVIEASNLLVPCKGGVRLIVQEYSETNGVAGYQPGQDNLGSVIKDVKVQFKVNNRNQGNPLTTDNNGEVQTVISAECNTPDSKGLRIAAEVDIQGRKVEKTFDIANDPQTAARFPILKAPAPAPDSRPGTTPAASGSEIAVKDRTIADLTVKNNKLEGDVQSANSKVTEAQNKADEANKEREKAEKDAQAQVDSANKLTWKGIEEGVKEGKSTGVVAGIVGTIFFVVGFSALRRTKFDALSKTLSKRFRRGPAAPDPAPVSAAAPAAPVATTPAPRRPRGGGGTQNP